MSCNVSRSSPERSRGIYCAATVCVHNFDVDVADSSSAREWVDLVRDGFGFIKKKKKNYRGKSMWLVTKFVGASHAAGRCVYALSSEFSLDITIFVK